MSKYSIWKNCSWSFNAAYHPQNDIRLCVELSNSMKKKQKNSQGTTSCISWARTWLDKQGLNSPVFRRFSMIKSVLITLTLRAIDIHKFPWEWHCLMDWPVVGAPMVVWGFGTYCWGAFRGLGTYQGERCNVNLIFSTFFNNSTTANISILLMIIIANACFSSLKDEIYFL